jgi:hypothetical protein
MQSKRSSFGTVALGGVLAAALAVGVATHSLPAARAQAAAGGAARQGGFAVARESAVGAAAVGSVHVNGRLVMRLRDTVQGGSGATQAERVARRLNELNGSGRLTADVIRLREVGNAALLLADEDLILAVEPEQARRQSSTPLALARAWRDNLAGALEPGTVAEGDRGATAIREEPRRTDRRRPDARRFEARQDVLRARPAALQRPEEETRSKLVPILTVGSSFRVGVAQVTGPVTRIDEVKAVARLDTDYKDRARIAVLVPVASENVVSNIRRVPRVSVTAVGDLNLKL